VKPTAQIFPLYRGTKYALRYAYLIRCTSVVKDEAGNVIEVHATYDPATAWRRRFLTGARSNRRSTGVSARHARSSGSALVRAVILRLKPRCGR